MIFFSTYHRQRPTGHHAVLAYQFEEPKNTRPSQWSQTDRIAVHLSIHAIDACVPDGHRYGHDLVEVSTIKRICYR